MIIHNTKEGEYLENQEILRDLLSVNDIEDEYSKCLQRVRYCTEDYQSWSILKDKLTDTTVDGQLETTVHSIGFNPKSYEAWFHRYFIRKSFPSVIQEIDLLLILLKADKRNLHCWNYISKVYNDFSFIPKDATNYTYLHYTKAFSPLSCIFTDPQDIGMWFYYFACKERDLLSNTFYVRKYKDTIEIVFKDLFEGEIVIGEVSLLVEVPIKHISLNITDISDIIIYNREYKVKKTDLSKKYYNDINELCICPYNMIFNYELWDKEEIKGRQYRKYMEQAEDDKYEIFVIVN